MFLYRLRILLQALWVAAVAADIDRLTAPLCHRLKWWLPHLPLLCRYPTVTSILIFGWILRWAATAMGDSEAMDDEYKCRTGWRKGVVVSWGKQVFNFSAPCSGGCEVRSSRVVMFECRYATDAEWVSHRQRKMNEQLESIEVLNICLRFRSLKSCLWRLKLSSNRVLKIEYDELKYNHQPILGMYLASIWSRFRPRSPSVNRKSWRRKKEAVLNWGAAKTNENGCKEGPYHAW